MKQFLLVLMLFLSACATSAGKKKLVIDRASFDLSCEKNSISIVELGSMNYGATGCGKKAAYVISCPERMIDTSQCTAILNSKTDR